MFRSLERRISASFALATLVLTLVGAAAWWSLARFERGFSRVDHTRQVLNGLNEILVHALNVQAGSRGFALSGDELFLEPYQSGLDRIQASIAEVRELTNDNPRQQAALNELQPLVYHLVDLMEERNAQIRAGIPTTPDDMSVPRSGKETMDQIRAVIDRMAAHEDALLTGRTDSLRQQAARTRAILLFAVAASLIIVALAGTRVHFELRARQRAAIALQRSRTVFETLFEQATDAFVVVDRDGIIRRVNRRTEDLFGYTRAELLGQPVERLMPERFEAVHRRHREGYVQSAKFRAMGAGLELYARRKDGGEFPVDIMLSPLETDEGHVVLAAIRDITERKAAAEALRRHSADLEVANEQLEAFSYSVSHDLRAPLRHMGGFANILAEHLGDKLDAEGRHYLDVIGRAVTKMSTLIDDLLAFARLGRAPMKVASVDTAALVRELVASGELEGSARVEWRIGPLPVVAADPALLRQVWINLLGNAVKYSAHANPPRIEIGAVDDPAAPTVTFRVSDNGVGFDPAHADKLFNVFARLHTEREFAGTGVGLALVKRILTRHGGTVRGESEPGRGATFWFTLPRRPMA